MRDTSTIVFACLTVVFALACYLLKGPEVVADSVTDTLALAADVAPAAALGIMVAGFVSVLTSSRGVAGWLGSESGMRGILLATGLGIIMPGGPFASFPLVYALASAGADIGTLVAFLVAWATLGISRSVVWEIPVMGLEFAAVRWIASFPVPVLAGLIARQLSRRFAFFGRRDK